MHYLLLIEVTSFAAKKFVHVSVPQKRGSVVAKYHQSLLPKQWRQNDKNMFYWFAVGNKDDDPERKVVLTHDAQRFAEQMGIQLYETSAKENINVEEVSYLTHFVNFLDMICFSVGKI